MRIRSIVVAGMLALCASGAWAATARDMVKDLNEGNAEKQLSAAMQLGDFTQFPEVVKALTAKVSDVKADSVVRANCAIALGRVKDPSVAALVTATAKNADEQSVVRAGCATAMAMTRGEEAIPDFAEMLKTEKSGLVRNQIEGLLSKMPDPQRVIVAVTPLLTIPDADASAIRVLGAVGGPAVIAPLTRQLREGKDSTRRAVVQALGSIPHPDAARALIAYFPKATDTEKVDILGALANHPIPESSALMIAQVQGDKVYPAVRRRAVLSLGMLRAKDGIPTLVHALLNTAEDKSLRLTCIQALGSFSDRDDTAIAGLIGVLADKTLAEEASIALNRISHQYFGTDKEKWAAWFQEWRQTRDTGGSGVGH